MSFVMSQQEYCRRNWRSGRAGGRRPSRSSHEVTNLPNCEPTRCGDTAEDVNRSVTGRCTVRRRTAAALNRGGRMKNEVIAARVAASCSLVREACDKKDQSISADMFW